MNNENIKLILISVMLGIFAFLFVFLYVKRLEILDLFLKKKATTNDSFAVETKLEELARRAGIPNGNIFAASAIHVGYTNARNAIIAQVSSIPLSRKFMIIGYWAAASEAAERAGKNNLSSLYKESWKQDNIEDIFGDLTTALINMTHNERATCAKEFGIYGMTTLEKYVLDIDSAIVKNLEDGTDGSLNTDTLGEVDPLQWN